VTADGHGGADVSKYMKTHFYGVFLKALDDVYESDSDASARANGSSSSSSSSTSHVTASLRKALASIDHDMLTGPQSRHLHQQGATSCMVYLHKSSSGASSLISANVGDSRAVLARGGRAVDLTEDHKPDLPSERARGTHSCATKTLLAVDCS
jgi:serine/threonine protein phosphatase PrpC